MTTIGIARPEIIYGEPIRTVAPATLAVSLDTAVSHIRNEEALEDELLTIHGMIQAATELVENYAGLGLITQTWQQTFSGWPSLLTLRRRPLIALGSPAQAVTITYRDGDNAVQELAPTEYVVSGVGGQKYDPTVRAASTGAFPTVYAHPEAITVTYTVGFGSNEASVPALIKHAVLLTFGALYEHREDLTDLRLEELPMSSKALLRDWRPLAVA